MPGPAIFKSGGEVFVRNHDLDVREERNSGIAITI